jgi:hypothetical protein
LAPSGSIHRPYFKKTTPGSGAQVFIDIGMDDPELVMAQQVETQFNDFDILHEWHLYSGAHTEEYWGAHIEEYMRWYAGQWNNPQ